MRQRRAKRPLLTLAAVTLTLTAGARPAAGEPQASVGRTIGAAGEGLNKQFWKRRDPNPATEENEMKEEHYRRIAYANTKWGTEKQAGWKTERGRMYIQRGPPDEIEAKGNREQWLYRYPKAVYDFKTDLTVGVPLQPLN